MLSIITFNIRFGRADDEPPNDWASRKEIFPLVFEKYRPDFIGFQEVNDFQADFLTKLLSEYNYIGERRPAPGFWQSNIIFYKKEWECIYEDRFFLSPTPDIPSRSRNSVWPRQCTIGMFQKEDRKVICANTHFDFAPDVQTESAGIITDRLSSMPQELPILLFGDFNAEPSAPCHIFLTSEDRKSDMFANILKPPFPGTFHGFTGEPEGRYIDWILYRGPIIPKKTEIIRYSLDGIYPSDHFPVYGNFQFR